MLECSEDVRRAGSRAIFASGTSSSGAVGIAAACNVPPKPRARISGVYEGQQKTACCPVWKIGMIANETKVLKIIARDRTTRRREV